YCSDNTGTVFDAEHPTLTLVIRTRTQLADVITQVSRAITTVISDLAFDPDYLRRFVLVTFNNNRLTTKSFSNSESLLEDLKAAAETTDSNGTCVDIDFVALEAALSQYLTYKSPVYVITDALPTNDTQVDNVYLSINEWRSPVYFLYVEPSPESGCRTSTGDPAYRLADTVAQRSAGQTFYFCSRGRIGTLNTVVKWIFSGQLRSTSILMLACHSRITIYASNGIWRGSCTYNFYFAPFECDVPNELLHFNFFAQDLQGYAVQRAGVMYCAR
ncbi:hypothetical protein TELCIR_16773, partial [Teladorsagia circumcincta]